jgi:hypothetical protein
MKAAAREARRQAAAGLMSMRLVVCGTTTTPAIDAVYVPARTGHGALAHVGRAWAREGRFG